MSINIDTRNRTDWFTCILGEHNVRAKFCLALSALLVFATSGNADVTLVDGDLEQVNLTLLADGTTVVNDGPSLGPTPTVVYDNIAAGPGGFLAFAPAAGIVGGDDYVSTIAPGFDLLLSSFSFVGGVTSDDPAAPGGTIDFLIGGQAFNVGLGMDGNFIYNINVAPTVIDAAGTIEASVVAGATGQFFLGDGVPVVGSTAPGSLLNADFDHHFSLTGTPVQVPEPASLAILGGLGLGMVIRRRR